MEDRSWIGRDVVIAWAIVQKEDIGRKTLTVRPLTMNWDGHLDKYKLTIANGNEVVAVIPAAPETYQVWGGVEGPGGHPGMVLGYQIPGVIYPDWRSELIERLEREKEGGQG